MSRSRAATPAGRSRKTASRGTSTTPRRPAPKSPAGSASPTKPTKRSGAKGAAARPATKRATTKKPAARKPAARKTAAKKPAAKRPAARRAPRKPPKQRRSVAEFTRSAFGAAFGGISWRYRLGIAALLLVCAGAGYFFWLRDSSLVAIDNVDVVGVTSGERGRIIDELTQASEGMTTLHVDRAKLESIAAGFPTVASIDIDPNFPHGMRIEVSERPPTMIVDSGGRQVPVAADGTLLTGVSVPDDANLPVLEVDQIPSGPTLGGEPLDQALVVGAAPEPLRPLIEKIAHSKEFGVEVTMRGGIPIRFGTGSAAAEKWESAAAVLADPKLDSLSYVDVRVPERPAAGGAADTAVATDPLA